MNTKGNQRYQETKNRIKWALLQILKEEQPQVTVSKICEIAQIHRTTFYGHYEDINFLFDEMIRDMYTAMMSYFMTEDGQFHADGFTKVFELVGENPRFFLYYFKNIHQSMEFEQMIPKLMLENQTYLEEKMGLQSFEELVYQQGFFNAGYAALAMRWIERGCRESPEVMGKLMERNFKQFFRVGSDKISERR